MFIKNKDDTREAVKFVITFVYTYATLSEKSRAVKLTVTVYNNGRVSEPQSLHVRVLNTRACIGVCTFMCSVFSST